MLKIFAILLLLFFIGCDSNDCNPVEPTKPYDSLTVYPSCFRRCHDIGHTKDIEVFND